MSTAMLAPQPRRTASSGPSTPVPSGARNNPIALRIYKAVGMNFDDRASREALEIASSFYSSRTDSPAGKGKERAGNGGGMEEGSEVDGEVDADAADDIVPVRRTLRGQSAAVARKNLKRDVEARLAGGAQQFLDAFGEVDKVRPRFTAPPPSFDAHIPQKLDVLREHMLEMQSRCDAVQAELDQANSGTKFLLERADGLRSQR